MTMMASLQDMPLSILFVFCESMMFPQQIKTNQSIAICKHMHQTMVIVLKTLLLP